MPKENQPFDTSTNMTTADALEKNASEIAEVKRMMEEAKERHAQSMQVFDEQIQLRTEGGVESKTSVPIEKNADTIEGSSVAKKKNKNMLGRLDKAAQTARANQQEARMKALEQKKTVKLKRQGPQYKMDIEVKGEEKLDKSKQIPFVKEYAKQGLGEIADKLSKMPAFEALPEGQKLLVMQGLNDRLYAHVKTTAAEQFQKEHAESGFFGKVWKGARRKYLTATHEKSALEVATGREADAFVQNIAPELITVFSKSGLDAYLDDDNKTVITKYSKLEKDADLRRGVSPENVKMYDLAASNFARIPDDWNKPAASKAEKTAYQKAEQEFTEAKHQYLNLVARDASLRGVQYPKAYAAEFAMESETTVRTMRLLSSHPEALAMLETIGTTAAWKKGLKDTITERIGVGLLGGVTNVGRVGRAGVTALFGAGSTMSLAAAPIIGVVVGGFRGNARA